MSLGTSCTQPISLTDSSASNLSLLLVSFSLIHFFSGNQKHFKIMAHWKPSNNFLESFSGKVKMPENKSNPVCAREDCIFSKRASIPLNPYRYMSSLERRKSCIFRGKYLLVSFHLCHGKRTPLKDSSDLAQIGWANCSHIRLHSWRCDSFFGRNTRDLL